MGVGGMDRGGSDGGNTVAGKAFHSPGLNFLICKVEIIILPNNNNNNT